MCWAIHVPTTAVLGSPGQMSPQELSFVVTFTYIGMPSSGLPSPPQYTVIKMLKPRTVAYTALHHT